ncbi:uncharacterized protein LOC120415574 [Culex pipiens pallens]|uniref:uncharacterized protein LOC120415574 n=1 Tax=Culex pipiens pallens TaxID=42434 RepID=UPI001953B800|nr:uncharacterized protein LOC120415574 [Culex pipiens pallens]XP_039433088.1 uncharacterized protein LOC120415574 [Culex pipiens pallens]
MTFERNDTFYNLDRIYSTIERMLVLIRQLSGCSRLGESGRTISLELQLLNTIDDRAYLLQELQDCVSYLFGQFRKIYLINKDLYVQLNKRGGRIFELEKQFKEQGESKCLYYMADVIKYEPALLAMQRVLDRTMREIRIFRNQRNKHKLELCISHIVNGNLDKAFDEFSSFENSIEQLPTIVEEVFDGVMKNLIKLLLFLKGYYQLKKPNSAQTLVTGCEFIVQYLKQSTMFCRVETVLLYSLINEVLQEEHQFEDFFRDRLELMLVDLTGNKDLAIKVIQTDPDDSSQFAKLFSYVSDPLLLEMIRRSYQGSSDNLKNVLKFTVHLPTINQVIICYQELYQEMRRLSLINTPQIFMLAFHIKRVMQSPKFPSATRALELEELKAVLHPNISSIIWKQISISRHESRILMKFSSIGKEINFTRYTADKNRFELEPVEEGEAFRIRNVAINGYLVEGSGFPLVANAKYDPSCESGHWRLVPCEECCYFQIENVASGRCLYSSFSEYSENDFYNSPELVRLTGEKNRLNENNSYWKIGEFSRGSRGDPECVIL